MISISYAITVCNEFTELNNLLNMLQPLVDINDEIVVLCDTSKTTEQIRNLCISQNNIKYHEDVFNGHFADWKNKLNSLCVKNYIFQIDADEIPNEHLLKNLKSVLLDNSSLDLLWVPRENFVENITDAHIKKWNWVVDDQNRINFPDYQARIYKNQQHIFWSGKVHETIIGVSYVGSLPPLSEWCLLHKKEIQKQEQQNSFYETLN
jgi:hypothetical protein